MNCVEDYINGINLVMNSLVNFIEKIHNAKLKLKPISYVSEPPYDQLCIYKEDDIRYIFKDLQSFRKELVYENPRLSIEPYISVWTYVIVLERHRSEYLIVSDNLINIIRDKLDTDKPDVEFRCSGFKYFVRSNVSNISEGLLNCCFWDIYDREIRIPVSLLPSSEEDFLHDLSLFYEIVQTSLHEAIALENKENKKGEQL